MNEIHVGLIGLGTVGCGLVKVLEDNSEMLKERLGVPLRLKRVVDIDLESPRPVSLPRKILSTHRNMKIPPINVTNRQALACKLW